MSSNPERILKAEHISKKFQLGQFVSLPATLRTIRRICFHPGSFFKPLRESDMSDERIVTRDGKKYLWALKDISFEVYRGERIAILGRNGAGKSTLLKVLVGIMSPTHGSFEAHCRIVPLMGVGAGFNPDLTGKENVFIYGAILGVHPKEIKASYNDVVAFAEIGDFMDTPLKRYSKGMRARLAMAVALNLKPDVLVVDEVLAVGDVKFRAKCMDAMKALCDSGMTLLFVSHSPARVKSLCTRAILLRDGKLVADGNVHQVLDRYLNEDMADINAQDINADEEISGEITTHSYLGRMDWELEHAPGDEVVQIIKLRVLNDIGEETQDLDISKDIYVEMQYVVHQAEYILRPQFQFFNTKLEGIFVAIDCSEQAVKSAKEVGIYSSRMCIPANLLGAETFVVGASVYSHRPLEKHARTGEVISFTVHEAGHTQTAQSDYPPTLPGYFRPLLTWQTSYKELEYMDAKKVAL